MEPQVSGSEASWVKTYPNLQENGSMGHWVILPPKWLKTQTIATQTIRGTNQIPIYNDTYVQLEQLH